MRKKTQTKKTQTQKAAKKMGMMGMMGKMGKSGRRRRESGDRGDRSDRSGGDNGEEEEERWLHAGGVARAAVPLLASLAVHHPASLSRCLWFLHRAAELSAENDSEDMPSRASCAAVERVAREGDRRALCRFILGYDQEDGRNSKVGE